jgi:Uma2 family endonuclease
MAMAGELRYVRALAPVHFPSEAEVPETKRHFRLRTLLYDFLALAFSDRATIGCDQFVYWDPTDPKACLAPDAFVRLGRPDHLFRSWKVWEHGAPQLAVEVISDADESDRDWDAKLSRYQRLGITELVRFDPDSNDRRLRVWDSIEEDLVERELDTATAASRVLPGHWSIVEDPTLGFTLRLSEDELGQRLYPTATEKAEQRIRELETELSRRSV